MHSFSWCDQKSSWPCCSWHSTLILWCLTSCFVAYALLFGSEIASSLKIITRTLTSSLAFLRRICSDQPANQLQAEQSSVILQLTLASVQSSSLPSGSSSRLPNSRFSNSPGAGLPSITWQSSPSAVPAIAATIAGEKEKREH